MIQFAEVFDLSWSSGNICPGYRSFFLALFILAVPEKSSDIDGPDESWGEQMPQFLIYLFFFKNCSQGQPQNPSQ